MESNFADGVERSRDTHTQQTQEGKNSPSKVYLNIVRWFPRRVSKIQTMSAVTSKQHRDGLNSKSKGRMLSIKKWGLLTRTRLMETFPELSIYFSTSILQVLIISEEKTQSQPDSCAVAITTVHMTCTSNVNP